MKPLIGITSYAEDAHGALAGRDRAHPVAYVRAIEHAGGRPLLVPPDEDGIEETLDALDGILFSGGGDLDPAKYGADPHPETKARTPSATAPSSRCSRRRSSATCPCSRSAAAPGPERRPRRRPRAAPARRVGHEQHKEQPGVFSEHGVRARPLGSLLGEHAPGEVAPPPGLRPRRRGSARGRLGRGRHGRGARGSREALRARRALAPGGRRGQRLFEALVRGARTGSDA